MAKRCTWRSTCRNSSENLDLLPQRTNNEKKKLNEWPSITFSQWDIYNDAYVYVLWSLNYFTIYQWLMRMKVIWMNRNASTLPIRENDVTNWCPKGTWRLYSPYMSFFFQMNETSTFRGTLPSKTMGFIAPPIWFP